MKTVKNPTRITVALDEDSLRLLENTKKETELSQSEILRQSLRLYCESRITRNPSIPEKLPYYLDMLLHGEHVILDVDHWLLFLRLVDSSPEKKEFWEGCRMVARAHAEQLADKIQTVEDLLDRLEACNFFRLIKNSDKDFTLMLGSEIPKDFVRIFIEEFSLSMGFQTRMKEDLAKLRVKVED